MRGCAFVRCIFCQWILLCVGIGHLPCLPACWVAARLFRGSLGFCAPVNAIQISSAALRLFSLTLVTSIVYKSPCDGRPLRGKYRIAGYKQSVKLKQHIIKIQGKHVLFKNFQFKEKIKKHLQSCLMSNEWRNIYNIFTVFIYRIQVLVI